MTFNIFTSIQFLLLYMTLMESRVLMRIWSYRITDTYCGGQARVREIYVTVRDWDLAS